MKYWEIVASDLSERGWSWGYTFIATRSGTFFSVDAHRDSGERYMVMSDQLLTAFLELQSQTRKVGALGRN